MIAFQIKYFKDLASAEQTEAPNNRIRTPKNKNKKSITKQKQNKSKIKINYMEEQKIILTYVKNETTQNKQKSIYTTTNDQNLKEQEPI